MAKKWIASLLVILMLTFPLSAVVASEGPPGNAAGATAESAPGSATESAPGSATESAPDSAEEPLPAPESVPDLTADTVTESVYLPFILRNENFAFHERTDAVIIDAGKEVDGASLSADDFDVHVLQTRIVKPEHVAYDGPRQVIGVYVSEVNDVGSPSDTGRYIVVDFPDVGWGDGGSTNDEGYTFDSQYTITYKGAGIRYADGTSIVPDGFTQTGVVSPVLDKFQYDSFDGLDYSYFLSEAAEGPLPLVVFFHGGGQGNDIYTPIRFSNGGTVWANPENQAKYPTHVLAPRNATSPEAMHKVKAVIDKWIEEGKVDPNRIYITGFSMGGGSTWTFLQTFPDFPAAAAPLCPAGGPGSVENAQKVAHLPLWVFVDDDDFLYDIVVRTYNTYSPYWHDSKLSILPENRLNNPPYNGFVFDGHAVWLPVYNEYVDEERGMLIDWLFAQSKVRGIKEVSVTTTAGKAPVLPDKVKVDIRHNATGVASEERAVVWDAVDPASYAKPGTFTVQGTVEGIVEKAVAKVTVRQRSSSPPYVPPAPAPAEPEPEETPDLSDDGRDGQDEPGKDEEPARLHPAYVRGFDDGTFRPDQAITRAELAVLLARNLGFDGARSGSSSLKDVKASHWAAAEIAYVKRAGLMGVDAHGNFRPGDPVTRAEMAAIAARHKKLGAPAGAKPRFADVQPTHWAAASIEAAAAAGILNGYGDGKFGPNNHLTRAEAVKAVNRMFGRGPLYGVPRPSWPDVPTTHWAYHEIEEASRDHHYALRPGGEDMR
jgi:Predicted peptidase